MDLNSALAFRKNLDVLGFANVIANIAASSTDAALVTAVTGKRIKVHQLFCQAGGTATNITFNSKPGGAGVAISPVFQNASNGGAVLPISPLGWFTTAVGEGLTATTGAGSTTGVIVVYSLVD